jgi:spermidine/putrescine transport system substrate-binding protein
MEHDHNNEEPLRILAPKGHPMTRRSFMSIAAAGAGALVMLPSTAAFADTSKSALEKAARTAMKSAGKTTNSLYLYTWGQYDNPTTFTDWKDATGFAVQVGSYDSNEALIAKLELAKGTAGYDIIVPTGGYIPEMVAKGLLLPLDKSKIPNFANLDPALLNFPWDRGNKYTIPKDYGTTGFIYDKTVIKKKLRTWQDFADAAALPEVGGRMSLLDAPNEALGIALWAAGVDWNTTNTAKLHAAGKWLIKYLAPYTKSFDSYPGGAGGLVNGSYVLSQDWNGDARLAKLKDPSRFEWVVPFPKSEIWVDNWAIAKGAKNVDTAHAFIDYVLSPVVSANEMLYIGYNTGLRSIEQYLPKNLPEASMIIMTSEERKRLSAYVVNSTYNLRTQIYDEFKAAAAS